MREHLKIAVEESVSSMQVPVIDLQIPTFGRSPHNFGGEECCSDGPVDRVGMETEGDEMSRISPESESPETNRK